MRLVTKRREPESGHHQLRIQSLGGSRSILNTSLPNSNQLRIKILLFHLYSKVGFTMLQDVQPDELNITDEPMLVYFYTPFCGTCREAKRMLNLALKAAEWKSPAFSCDLNFAPNLAEKWEIQSVPCLICFENGEMKEKVYAFQSVSFLFDWLKKVVQEVREK